ncbi:MAG: helix-turn-helix transcriptional regulator [Oligoflexia bacterium]|nr:helix-turn-helix transcriptional regulator [Oligoflexia bacterium]
MTNQILLNELGRFIRQERKQRGLNQLELADLSATSINFISHIEKGKPTAHIGKIMDVLRILGIQLNAGYGSEVISFKGLIKDES